MCVCKYSIWRVWCVVIMLLTAQYLCWLLLHLHFKAFFIAQLDVSLIFVPTCFFRYFKNDAHENIFYYFFFFRGRELYFCDSWVIVFYTGCGKCLETPEYLSNGSIFEILHTILTVIKSTFWTPCNKMALWQKISVYLFRPKIWAF